jgi:hypothetical protein
MDKRGESEDLGIPFVKCPVLALEFEQEALNLAKRPAFNGRANFGDKLRRSRLAMAQESRNTSAVALYAERSPFIDQRRFQIATWKW